MQLLRGIWLLLRWVELIAAQFVPARVARKYLRWRLRTDVPRQKRCAMLALLAAVERKHGDLTSSEAAAREAIESCRDDWWSHVELARTLEVAGRPSEAREELKSATEAAEFDERYRAHIEGEMERLEDAS